MIFDFLIGVFGGLYYGGRTLYEMFTVNKSEEDSWYTKFSRCDVIRNQWLSEVTSPHIERISEITSLYEEETASAIKTLRKVCGYTIKYTDAFDQRLILMTKMLKYGAYIPREEAVHGITVEDSNKVGKDAIKQRVKLRKFLTWYNRELLERGMKEPIIYISVDDLRCRNMVDTLVYSIPLEEEIKEDHTERGIYYWAPAHFKLFFYKDLTED